MEQLNNVDVVFLIIIGISALVGIARGMTKELLSITGWVLAAVALYYLVPMLEPIAMNYIASKMMADIVSGLAIIIVFSIIWILLVDKLTTTVRASKMSSLDRILGFVFGAARGVLIVVLIALMVTTIIPEESKQGAFAESQYFQIASDNVEPLKNLVPQSWIDSVKEKSKEFALGSKAQEKEDADNKKETVASKEDVVENTGESTQDKAAAEEQEDSKEDTSANNNTEGLSADIDKLFDDLEDLVVKTETENNDDISEVKEKVIEKISEGVAEGVNSTEANAEVMKKSGEELFEELAQPKTVGEADAKVKN